MLKDNSGATLIMALLALLVAAMVSAVILAAATTSVKQEKMDREFQQCQLDLQSAAQFVLADIVGEGEGNRKDGISVELKLKSDSDTGADLVIDNVTATGGIDSLRREFEKAVEKVHKPSALSSDIYTSPSTFGISFESPNADGGNETRTVKTSLVMRRSEGVSIKNDDSGYEVIFTFESDQNSNYFGNSKNPVLYMRLIEVASPSNDGSETTTYTYRFDRTYTTGEGA